MKTIIRYYDHVDETLAGKTLKPQETALLAKNGFRVLVVFQHFNDQFGSFTPQRGQQDAIRSVQLAGMNSQPKGSAIYFGVDGDWGRSESEMSKIRSYFQNAAAKTRQAGFKVGAYAGGLVCKKLIEERLVDFCWLSMSKGWPGYKQFHETNLNATII